MARTDYQAILEEITEEIKPEFGRGVVADYIPALADVPANKFGMAAVTVDGEVFRVGDADEPFSIQSISKVFTLTLALNFVGETLWQRVGREPSGTAFNSLVQLEYEQGIPRNPFINAGSLVITDIICSRAEDPNALILNFVRHLAGPDSFTYNLEVARSELEHGDRNMALAHFLRSFGNIKNEVNDVVEAYFHQCALAASCVNLARAFLFLANRGVSPRTGDVIVPERRAKRINAIMLTCGMYDAVGDVAFRVGLPGKSGVGGGIIAIVPEELALCVWSPELNRSGNSLVGTQALELFTEKTGKSIF